MKCPNCHFENPEDTLYCGKCGARLLGSGQVSRSPTATLQVPKKELTTGSTFASRYQVIEELGKGGMGKVYKVFDKEIEEKVALKLLKPEIASDEETIKRFRNEIRVARKITHKNICRMHDLGQAEGTLFITMEYIEGEDLKSLIRRIGQLPIGKSLAIARQVGEGLVEAHKLGIVHRDLKPHNIMVDKEGNARIMDFGIARSLKTKGITGGEVMIGTPEYMSPEQVEGKAVDERSDIYALGVILYEMVTGKVPFEGDTALSVALKHKTEAPQDPREFNAQIPENLSHLILRCMEKDRDKRYPGAEEVISEITTIEQEIPLTRKDSAGQKVRSETTKKSLWKKFALYGGIPALSVLIVLAGVYLLRPKGKAISSIAVLPFAYTGADPNLEYLSEGMPESIINSLQQLSSLKKVIALSSVMRYKAKDVDPQVIRQELGVDAVLVSKINQLDDALSIRVELVRTADNSRIWGNQYNRKVSEIFSVQEEISHAIVANLRLKLGGEEKKRLAKRYTESPQAYQDYLTGRFYWNKRTKEGLLKGLEYFNEAIERDPGYSLAYAGLADSYALLGRYSYLPPAEAFPKGTEAVEKALDIDKTLGEAHTSLAFIKRYSNFDWAGAEKEYKLAIEFSPNYATAHHWYALQLSMLGRNSEALTEIRRAVELDPLSLIINTNLAWVYYFARDYDRAVENFKKTLEMDPNYAVAHQRLGQTYLEQELFSAAVAELEKAVVLSPGNTEILAALGHALGVSGKKEEAAKILENLNKLSEDSYVSAYDRATVYLGLGAEDKALEYLEKAYEQRSGYVTLIKADPRLDRLHSNPIFVALLKKMNLG
jgi:serine/threonine protein kinase/tetratricopeptide (TPR) repeat protein